MSHATPRVGVFRAIARSTTEPDYVLEMLLAHDGVDLPYDDCIGVTYDEVRADPDAAQAGVGAAPRHLRGAGAAAAPRAPAVDGGHVGAADRRRRARADAAARAEVGRGGRRRRRGARAAQVAVQVHRLDAGEPGRIDQPEPLPIQPDGIGRLGEVGVVDGGLARQALSDAAAGPEGWLVPSDARSGIQELLFQNQRLDRVFVAVYIGRPIR